MIDKNQANSEKVKRWAKVHPEKHREMNRKWAEANPERNREIKRKSHAKIMTRLRKEAIMLLGGACVRCQCTDIRCLQIDHIVPLQGKRRMDAFAFYRSIVRGATENLQVLCANCHAIKTYYENGGEDI